MLTAKNFEIKTPVSGYGKYAALAQSLKSKFHEFEKYSEHQKDIYYKVIYGRLKLRIINNSTGSLIFYIRNESTNKRVSSYSIAKTKDFKHLDKILQSQFDVLTVVSKIRLIFILDNIRIHLDKVKGLGNFLEFEIIFSNLKRAKKQMTELISYFKLDESKFIKQSYSDMLMHKKFNLSN